MVCDKTAETWKAVAIGDICQKKYMYTPKNRDDVRFTSFEALLSRIETKAAKLWRELAFGGFSMNLANQTLISEFMAILHLRNKNIQSLSERVINLRIKLYGLKDEGTTEFNYDQAGPVFLEGIMSAFPAIRDGFLRREWCFLQAKELRRFYTSDRPVLFVSQEGALVGPKVNNAFIFMPLLPNFAVFMMPGSQADHVPCIDVSDEIVEKLNALSRRNAIQFLISAEVNVQEE